MFFFQIVQTFVLWRKFAFLFFLFLKAFQLWSKFTSFFFFFTRCSVFYGGVSLYFLHDSDISSGIMLCFYVRLCHWYLSSLLLGDLPTNMTLTMSWNKASCSVEIIHTYAQKIISYIENISLQGEHQNNLYTWQSVHGEKPDNSSNIENKINDFG